MTPSEALAYAEDPALRQAVKFYAYGHAVWRLKQTDPAPTEAQKALLRAVLTDQMPLGNLAVAACTQTWIADSTTPGDVTQANIQTSVQSVLEAVLS